MDIRVKSYCHLNFLRVSIFNYEILDILRDSLGHPSNKLLSFDFGQSFYSEFRGSRLKSLRASVFNFESLDILQDSIGHLSKMLLSFEFAQSFCFQL